MADPGSAAFDLAQLSIQICDYEKARQALALAESYAMKTFGPEHPNYAALLQDQAKVERELAGPLKALPLYERALAILRAWPGCPEAALAACLSNLAFTNQALGRYGEAIGQFREAAGLVQGNAAPMPQKVYTSALTNLAELYCEIGQDERAEPLMREALAIDRAVHGPRGRALAASLNNLGLYLLRHGGEEEGARLLAEATQIIRALGTRTLDGAISFANQASLLRDARRYKEAEAPYTCALQTLDDLGAGNSPQAAQVNADAALAFAARGKFPLAETVLRKAVRIFEATLPRDHRDTNEARFSLFIVLTAQNKIDDAFALLRDTLASESAVMDSILRLGSEKDRLAYLTRLAWRLDAAVSFVVKHRHSDPGAAAWLFALLLKRRGLSAEALAAQRDTILGEGRPELTPKLALLHRLKGTIGRALLDPHPTTGLDFLIAEKADLERELAGLIPEIGLKLRLQALDYRAIAAELPPSAALIEFVRYTNRNFAAADARNEKLTGPDRYLALVVKPGEPAPEVIDLGGAPPIEDAVGAFLAVLAADGAGQRRAAIDRIIHTLLPGRGRALELKRLGESIEQSLLTPLKEFLCGIDRLVIVPDGVLMGLPFDCLPCDGGYCIDRWQIAYLATSRDLLSRSLAGTPPYGPALVVAAPDYDLDGVVPEPLFPPLEGTLGEGEAVAQWLGVTPLLGPDAAEATIKATRSPRILHIATHGFFLQPRERAAVALRHIASLDNPMLRSGLALAGANSFFAGNALPADAEDGILTAEDVTALDLRGTELVVLSACETGLGDVQSGEGVFGLRRAFGLAGARNLVVSLWKVADEETCELMKLFYPALLAGASTGAALQQAKLKMCELHPDPYFWGAFISLGCDAGPPQED